MAASQNHNPNSTTEQSRRLIRANTPEAYALWERRSGLPIYHFAQERTAWAITCAHCGQLRLLEVIVDSENGTWFQVEPCACGGVP